MKQLLMGLVVLVLCASSAMAGETVRVGYIPVGDCLQLYVAEELGYFKDEGLVVETTPLKGGALIAMAVEAGEIDLGWSNTASLAIAEDKGFDFAILSPGAFETGNGHRVHSLLTAKDSPVESVADLKGKTVAINNLGNINEIAIAALATENGLDPKSVKLVEVPFPQMEAALASGSVDAVLTLEPFVTIARSSGTARILEPAALKPFGDRFLIASWFGTRTWMNTHPETAEKFKRAVLRASLLIEKTPELARNILVQHTKLTKELAQSITLPMFAQTIEDSDAQAIIDLTARFGFIKKPFPATKLYWTTPK